MGWGFDIFQTFAVKFPAHGQIIPVKCNQISPPRAAQCYQISQGRTQERHNELSPNKTLKFLFINVAASPNIHVPVTAAIIRFNHNPCYTVQNTETFRRKSTFCKFEYTVLSKGYKESQLYKLTVIVASEPYNDQYYCTCKNRLGFFLLPFTLMPQYLKRFN